MLRIITILIGASVFLGGVSFTIWTIQDFFSSDSRKNSNLSKMWGVAPDSSSLTKLTQQKNIAIYALSGIDEIKNSGCYFIFNNNKLSIILIPAITDDILKLFSHGISRQHGKVDNHYSTSNNFKIWQWPAAENFIQKSIIAIIKSPDEIAGGFIALYPQAVDVHFLEDALSLAEYQLKEIKQINPRMPIEIDVDQLLKDLFS